MPDLTRELQRMADEAACAAQPLPLNAVFTHGTRTRRRSVMRRTFGGLSIAVAAAVVLAVTVLAPASRPATHHRGVQLVAWTVAKLPDGDIRVRIVRLRHPAALQRKLRADGVPASVVMLPPGPCRPYAASQVLLNKVFPGAYRLRPPPGQVFVIRPRALPSGTGIQLAGSFHHGPTFSYVAAPTLVHVSQRCTGS
jgi:hypothetical protein